ncbi:serine protease [Rhodococcus ruber]|uniref:Peptidase S1 family protein n=1 Tax=Rhodococcus ruber TaxID=1830 RepID=A0A098BN36_9NOCA|nr:MULTISPECIES: hypothetical protein [Rhodococcus]MCD2127055.1 S1 family peptidase [Rhodococcus ruber]MCZ1074549.1 serine protease [Rhodococcus sp. A5(2022)]MCZ4503348.1 serine protease [Rhodococcus ruber]MCZ4530557.1 serine protease [Rhodococcus ruber]MCZ4622928.1 serine protease [Rhodococcus ruber]
MRLGILVLAVGASLLAGTGVAAAADPAVLGGGSGIVMDGRNYCTLTTIGPDSGGRLVGFTAGHCGNAGSTVASEADPDAGVVGTITYTDADLDYAVIVFEPAKVVPVNRVGNTTITGIGGPAQFPDIVCKQGRTTGQTCGVAYGDVFGSGQTWTQTCVDLGDSGGPVVVGTTLVGMVNGYLTVACLGPEVGTSMTAVVGDADARGGAGAGFRPI